MNFQECERENSFKIILTTAQNIGHRKQIGNSCTGERVTRKIISPKNV